MRKLKESVVFMGSNKTKVYLYKLSTDDEVVNISRVYVLAMDDSKKIPLIYNSKRNIWGFPGGHVEESESIQEAANRECIEEIERSIVRCESKFLLVNKLDTKIEEKQLICFAFLGKKNNSLKDNAESVSKIKYLSIEEIKTKLGNSELWAPIFEDFNLWCTQLF